MSFIVMRWRVVLLLLMLVAALAVGWVAALAFQSPEQRAAQADPPPLEPIVEPVVTGRLADEVATRAKVVPEFVDAMAPTRLPENAVVTGLHVEIGAEVHAGEVLLDLNGRPVFLLPGDFPFYRDLAPDLTGTDVEQLQDGLAAAGYPIPDSERGRFGWRTRQALVQMYDSAGFEPPTMLPTEPGEESSQTVETSGQASEKEPAPPSPVPYLPLSEVLVASRLPATVAAMPAVGESAAASEGMSESEGPSANGNGLVTLHSGGLRVQAAVPASVAVRVEQGMPAELSVAGGDLMDATVSEIREVTGSQEPELGGYELVFTADTQVPSEWSKEDVLARITASVISEAALIVPTRALATNTDGEGYVAKLKDDGSFARVLVEELGTLAGRSAVKPLENGSLSEGDEVRVD